jgi:hypothetical protein
VLRVGTVLLTLMLGLVLVSCGGGEASENGGTKAGLPSAGFEPDDTTVADCRKTNDFSCYAQAYGNLTYHKGPRVSLRAVEQASATNAAVRAGCHRIVHTIGAAALVRYDGSVAKAFVEGSATCASGFYHGLIEHAFTGVPEDEIGNVAADVCDDPEIRRVGYYSYQCVHGLGHGLMIYTRYDMPQSLRVCDGLPNRFDAVSCTGGVFMENATSSYGIKSRWLKDDDLIYPCNAVAERHKYYCYLLVTSRILPAVDWSFRRTAEVCRQSEKDWVGECFESFGRDVAGNVQQDPTRIPPLCELAGANEADCIYGASRDIANADADGVRASALCRRVDREHRGRCFQGIGTILGSLHREADARAAACAAITDTYVADCRRGAGL